MDQVVDLPETETSAKRTLGGVLRTGALLAVAAFASVLLVDLPIPTNPAADGQGKSQPYVPASDKWIELGSPQRPAASSGSGCASGWLQAVLLHTPTPALAKATPFCRIPLSSSWLASTPLACAGHWRP